ncbi:MAG: V-type ATP synthase subunit F [Parcubacteria group bacterium]|nr:V-type ATP synthase subunit F [Parcubacteria group bacterium]
MKLKIAIIGSGDAVAGFKAVGVDAMPVKTTEEAEAKVKEVYDSTEYATLFITEDWIDQIKDFLDELPAKALPAIVAIPSQAGSTGAGLDNLKKIVEQAVGSDILSNE